MRRVFWCIREVNESKGGTEGGPCTERNERRSNMMIADEVQARGEHRNGVRGDRTR